MKKLSLCLIALILSMTFIPTQTKASKEVVPLSSSSIDPKESAKANSLLLRLNEIKNMDKKNLTTAEKRELRKEVRSTKSELKTLGGGVYLSVGAVIIILLLIILL